MSILNVSRILLIEDDPDTQFVITAVLEELNNVTVQRAGTGSEGLRQAKKLDPDLILLDYNLPDMNGLAVLKELRNRQATSTTPVIIMTAYPQDIATHYKESEVLNVLCKPFNPLGLSAAIEKILGDRGEAKTLQINFKNQPS